MNILFLTIAYTSGRNIYSDLMSEFRANGHVVWVVCQSERRNGQPTRLYEDCGINILRVKTGNITGKVSTIEKGLSTLTIEFLYKRAINKYLHNVKFDLVIYSTPPVTFAKVVCYMRNRDGAMSYLLLKDIFPQNAVDLGLIKDNGYIHKFFLAKEKNLYAASDYIGCLSEANIKYLAEHNPELDMSKVEVNPNSIKPLPLSSVNANERRNLREKYDIPTESVLFIYGGNLGLPQGLEFLVETSKAIKEMENIFLLIIGDGNRYDYLSSSLKQIGAENIRLLKRLPKEQYDELLRACDAGLLFLSSCFTIPNFPCRLLAYMEMSLPVIAATDAATDIKNAIQAANCGYWSLAGDLPSFMQNLTALASDSDLRQEMGKNGRKFLEENYTVEQSYKLIMKHFDDRRGVKNV